LAVNKFCEFPAKKLQEVTFLQRREVLLQRSEYPPCNYEFGGYALNCILVRVSPGSRMRAGPFFFRAQRRQDEVDDARVPPRQEVISLDAPDKRLFKQAHAT